MDISKIWPGWIITERLGHGGFGHVYKATCDETDAVAAVKVINIPDNPDIIEDLRYSGRSDDEILAMCHEEAEHMMEEIKVMQKLKGSANIVSIEDSALRKKEDSIGYDIYIRMEYLTPLKNHIAQIVPLTDEAVVKIGCDICSALEICHKKLPASVRSSTEISSRIIFCTMSFPMHISWGISGLPENALILPTH